MHQDQAASYTDPPSMVLDSPRSSKQSAVYAQDEMKVAPWLILNGGLRFDNYEEFNRTSPRAAVIFLPKPTESFKYLFGRAFRAPNSSELNTAYFMDQVHYLQAAEREARMPSLFDFDSLDAAANDARAEAA